MSLWSKTLYGKDVSVERAFRPLQHAMVRLGYEITDVREGRRIELKKRTDSSLAWDNHRRAHDARLTFKPKTKGFFTKEAFLEIEVTFSDWDMTVSDGAAKAWQQIADKLQVMLSDADVFLPLAPPAPLAVSAPLAPPVYQVIHAPAPMAPPPGAAVWVLWSDGQHYPGYVARADGSGAEVVLMDGARVGAPLSALSPREVPPPPPSQPQLPVIHHHVVERQVVVTRCKFCGQMTPVDWHACQSCGAAKFA